MKDWGKAFEAIADVLYPKTGEMPYQIGSFDRYNEGGEFLKRSHKLQHEWVTWRTTKPLIAVISPDRNREPVVMMTAGEFVRLLKRSEGWDDGI